LSVAVPLGAMALFWDQKKKGGKNGRGDVDIKDDPRSVRYFFIEKKGVGVRYHYRARKREETDTDTNVSKIEKAGKMIRIAWQRYFFNEGELSHPSEYFLESSLMEAPPVPYVKHLNFVQTVGMPERFFKIDSEITCLDPAGRPLNAKIRGIERNYYHVVYTDKSVAGEESFEWIHRNSSRLKLRTRKEPEPSVSDVFEALAVGMYVEAQYPDGTMARARVVHKHLDEKNAQASHVTVQFEGNRLSKQKVFSKQEINENKKVKLSDEDESANKTRLYISNFKAINLSVVPMNKEGGHSMFRALSYQLFGTETNWKAIRAMCVEHMIKHKNYFQHFIDCEFEQYIATKRNAIRLKDYYAPGDHLDLQAICEIFDVGVQIYSDKASRPFENITFYAEPGSQFQKLDLGRILLFYRGDEEYDSLVETGKSVPLKRKIGFQKTWKSLGELDIKKDIKGEILKARKRGFSLNNPHLMEDTNQNVPACVFEGEWAFSSEYSTEKTVLNLLKLFGLPMPTDGDLYNLLMETKSEKLEVQTYPAFFSLVIHSLITLCKITQHNLDHLVRIRESLLKRQSVL